MPDWVIVLVALGYIGLLFVIASYGDRLRGALRDRSRLFIYPLCLAIYCTSWTFFGSVGLASRNGFEFLTIYIGPILMIGLCTPLIVRIVRLAKAHNITSIADFIAARYGKSQSVAAAVATIAIIGSVPYIALQLKAVSASLGTILYHPAPFATLNLPITADIALFVALSMATFAVLFGTRHIDATEHQDGLMLAIAVESVVKLLAFLAVGVFVTFWLFGGPSELLAAAATLPRAANVLTHVPPFSTLLTMTFLSFFAIVLLPRQFHVTVVEHHDEKQIRRAAWLFPVYLVLINLFVAPIAIAGLVTFPNGGVDSDMFVLALPLAAGSQWMTIIAFVGGLSAATAMVIVECVALAIMISNDIVVPLVLQRRAALITAREDVGKLLLQVRRISIFAILLLAYLYYRSVGDAQLASIGLLSFAAVAQLAPAFFGGLIWRRATARGAIAGLTAGILVWAYTLLLPSLKDAGIIPVALIADGPFGLWLLRPQALMGMDLPPLAHGVVWSLSLNILAFIAFSLGRAPAAIERLQADLFVPSSLTPMTPNFRMWRSSVTVGELSATIARYLGETRTRTSFEKFAPPRQISLDPQAQADFQLLQHAEHLLASAIGAASSRIVLSLLVRKRAVSTKAALKLLDDASAAIHYNREILQTALDQVRQGIAVFDSERQLVCWNHQFGEILSLPRDFMGLGVRLDDILRFNAERGLFGPGDPQEQIEERIERYASDSEPFLERFSGRDLVFEVQGDRMPDGGFVTTFTDITPSVVAAQALERSNESLERRVKERTTELTHLNTELERAKADAEDANVSKTRFIAAASHDILQPLNAARLYVTSLVERRGGGEDGKLIGNIDASLEAVEEIFGALLDISRLDSGAMRPELANFHIGELLRQLEVEFAPLARERGLNLTIVPSSLTVRSDRRLLRRLLQNLISNAIKYSPKGGVVVGCRRRRGKLRIDVVDTGLGIPQAKKRAVFAEFHRLDAGAKVARGLGLGLSIVERIGKVLNHKIDLRSVVGRGSRFSVEVPCTAGSITLPAPDIAAVDPGQLSGITVLCIDNEPQILDGMRTLLQGWGCRVFTATDLRGAISQLIPARAVPNGVLVDYHLDESNGIDTIRALRQRFGATLPAILITADRTPQLREAARMQDVMLLNKPLKPAALRALLAQWRMQRVVAAE